MPQSNLPSEIQIKKFLTEEKTEILKLIDKHHRVLLQANPGSGKTHFFKELAKDIKSKKRIGRLVFVAPFLIITEQFKNDLSAKGIKVDLELRGDNKRKKLADSDKIITSTFQSLHHIIDDLTSDDILVVDEAHALFYNYNNDNISRQYYTITIQNLYHTKSKLVLMSGTPNLSLLNSIDLHHIKIIKLKEIKAKVNINFSKVTKTQIAKEFALKAINKNGTNSLNVIYIKSIKECNNICDMLIDLGYNAKVLTSFEKDKPTYRSISDIEKVPNDVQFIVTTNVISTGANIQNTNVGSALILNEFNAAEIKQFSKRFRKKPDIEIDVVNKPFESKTSNSIDMSKINGQREFINDSLKFHSTSLINANYNFDFDKDEESITPNISINRILDAYLRMECSVIDKSVDLIDSPKDLADQLNEYDDIDAVVMPNLNVKNTNQSKKSVSSWDVKTKKLIKNFSSNIDAYLSAMRSNHNQDWHSINKIKNLTFEELKNNVAFSQKIKENINSAIFLKEISPMFLKYREFFKTTKDFLIYLEHKNTKTQRIIPLSLLFNGLFQDYFNVSKNTSLAKNNLSLKLKSQINIKHLTSEYQALLILVQKTFEFSVFKDNLVIEELVKHLENDKDVIKVVNEIKFFEIINPGDLKQGKNSFKFNNSNLVKALVNSIFYTEIKRKGANKITSVTFKNILPSGYSNEKIQCSKGSVTFKGTNGTETTVNFGAKNLGVSQIKFLNSYKLILEESVKKWTILNN